MPDQDYRKELMDSIIFAQLTEQEKRDYYDFKRLIGDSDKTVTEYYSELDNQHRAYQAELSEIQSDYDASINEIKTRYEANIEAETNEVKKLAGYKDTATKEMAIAKHWMEDYARRFDKKVAETEEFDKSMLDLRKSVYDSDNPEIFDAKKDNSVYKVEFDKTINNNKKFEEIITSILEYKSGDKNRVYKNADAYTRLNDVTLTNYIDSYMVHYERYNQMEEELKKTEDKLKTAEADLAEKKKANDVKMQEEIDKVPTNSDKQKELNKNISQIKLKMDDVAKFRGMQDHVNRLKGSNELSEQGKETGLDLLTKARAEYRNNCNWWERLWANILSPERYSKAAYVQKINAYKSVLKENGIDDKKIDDADPDKSGNFEKDKNGKYVSLSSKKLDVDAINTLNELADDNDEPAAEQKKGKVRVADVNQSIGKDTGSQEFNKDNKEMSKSVSGVKLDKSQKGPDFKSGK